MNCAQLKVNSKFYLYGRAQVVTSIDPPNVTYAGLDGTGEPFVVDFISLYNNPYFQTDEEVKKEIKKEKKVEHYMLETLPEHKQKRVYERLNIIKPMLLLERVKAHETPAIVQFMSSYNEFLPRGDIDALQKLSREKLLSMLSDKYTVSVRTLQRWIEKFKEEEKETGLGVAGLMTKNDKGYIRNDDKTLAICQPKHPEVVLCTVQTRLPDAYLPIIKKAIEEEYLTLKKITPVALYDIVKTRCELEVPGLPELPEITLRKLLDRLDPQVVTQMRSGKSATQKLKLVERGFSNKEALYPLHMVEIDHTPINLDVLDDLHTFVVGRPNLTLGIDVYSRMIWCMYITFEENSTNVMRKALEQGMFVKRSKERYGTLNEWDIHGRPQMIFTDNGSDFKSAHFRRMVEHTLGAELRYRPVRTPHVGGTIERLCGTFMTEFIDRIDGARKSNPKELGEYDAEGEACLTLSELIKIATWYVTDVYHHSVHKGLPPETPTPTTRYYEGLKKTAFLPEYFSPEYEDFLRMQLLPIKDKRITRDGIRLGNVIYSSNQLAPYVGKSQTYNIKYDIDDISKVYFQSPETSDYIEISAISPSANEVQGMSRFLYSKILKRLREEGKVKSKEIPGTGMVTQGQLRIQDEVAQLYKKSRRSRKFAAKTNMVPILTQANTNKDKPKEPSFANLLEKAKAIEQRKKEND
ncbi:Mu transposase C-terminal domain-containing protein [Desulfitobacterium sp.]|uniref:Mu transposase C-terminal domain-containing protein n=1 Tax=Desulfitobacterium sp. TaxID=49981 RepID=UPI002B1F025D|nr:Mu transposase C-terminal domain-containing protein [Desulfitobacterium sp.]MEA4900705.1 Mu transposase C-terminal domain-containing protein [Desulfitobacterium sp.]